MQEVKNPTEEFPMTTNNNTSAAAHAAPATEAGLTTLDPSAGYITTMNTYTVVPERVEEVLEYLVRSAAETVRYVPGFVSMNFHVSLDRIQIVNYSQWKSREAMAAARENPKIVALMSETTKIAGSSKPIPYELRKSVPAPSK
jgi:quinol monooxygenase YgiN